MLHRALSRLNESTDALVARTLAKTGSHPEIVAYGGIASEREVRLRGRVLMSRTSDQRAFLRNSRGYRQLLDAQVPRQPVRVALGNASTVVRADADGYIDVTLTGHGLGAGWHDATYQVLNADDVWAFNEAPDGASGRMRIRAAEPVPVQIRVVGDDETTGVVTDIDDTAMVSNVPRLMSAAYLFLVEEVRDRTPVPGMATFLTLLTRRDRGRASVAFYLTSNVWNNFTSVRAFLDRNQFPRGAIAMTDFGMTPTGWFRSGKAHKRTELERLHAMLPQVKWYLVGDDGEHDPDIYTAFAREFPEAVAGIAIRSVRGTGEKALGNLPAGIPVWVGRDGDALMRAIGQ